MTRDKIPTGREWLQTTAGQACVDAAAQHAATQYADELRTYLSESIVESDQPLGSPLEAMFLVWWKALVSVGQTELMADPTFGLLLCPQETVVTAEGTRYRLDFSIVPDDPEWVRFGHDHGIHFPGIAVELDGHAWHERTPDQVVARNARDRDLQRDGWTVFHFSGRELHRDALGCVIQVLKHAQDAHWTWTQQIIAQKRTPDSTATP